MTLVHVEVMTNSPGTCLHCGSAPRDPGTDELLPAIHMEGIDVNWGDDVYVCHSCVRIMGELMGMATPDEVEEVRDALDKEVAARQMLEQEIEELKTFKDRVVAGSRAVKEARRT